MPAASIFGVPPAYPLLLVALTFVFDRNAVTNYGLRLLPYVSLGVLGGLAMYLVRALAMMAIFGVPLELRRPPLGMLVSSVIVEELLFRGYAFKTLVDTRGMKLAMVVFAIAFGIYHWVQWNLWNQPVAMVLILISTGLAHVFFALAFLRSGSLWLPIGLHLGWNASEQALRLSGLARTTATFLTGYAISLLVLLIALAVINRALPARPLPEASP